LFLKGVDDILALLLAFSAKPEELEVLLVSITFGNIDVQKYAPFTQADQSEKQARTLSNGLIN